MPNMRFWTEERVSQCKKDRQKIRRSLKYSKLTGLRLAKEAGVSSSTVYVWISHNMGISYSAYIKVRSAYKKISKGLITNFEAE